MKCNNCEYSNNSKNTECLFCGESLVKIIDEKIPLKGTADILRTVFTSYGFNITELLEHESDIYVEFSEDVDLTNSRFVDIHSFLHMKGINFLGANSDRGLWYATDKLFQNGFEWRMKANRFSCIDVRAFLK